METKKKPDIADNANLSENKEGYAQQFSEKGLWNKIKNTARKTGEKTIYQVLVLFYTMREPATPVWCKGVILGTLGYFISLIDAIPDLTPIFGYTDDITLIVAAIGTLAAYITPEIESKAKEKTKQIFKDGNETDLSVDDQNEPSQTNQQQNGSKK